MLVSMTVSFYKNRLPLGDERCILSASSASSYGKQYKSLTCCWCEQGSNQPFMPPTAPIPFPSYQAERSIKRTAIDCKTKTLPIPLRLHLKFRCAGNALPTIHWCTSNSLQRNVEQGHKRSSLTTSKSLAEYTSQNVFNLNSHLRHFDLSCRYWSRTENSHLEISSSGYSRTTLHTLFMCSLVQRLQLEMHAGPMLLVRHQTKMHLLRSPPNTNFLTASCTKDNAATQCMRSHRHPQGRFVEQHRGNICS